MQPKGFIALATFAFAAGLAGLAHAQATAASGSVVVLPVIAQTSSYTSTISVQNPNSAPITVSVRFYEATNSSTPGLTTCNALTVPALAVVPFTLPDQCTDFPTGSHFGMLIMADTASQQTDVFFAYSRVQTPDGNGFSIEGFPIGAFSGASADAVGIKRQAAAPGYQSNCFVAALGEAIDYQIVLRDGTTNAIIGTPLTGTLQPYQETRFLDVFAKAGALAGDYSNIRANFTATTADSSPGAPAFVGLCTVQDNTYFSADFRIAKSIDALNEGMKRVACIGQDSCGTVSASDPETISGPTLRNVYSMIITQPDFVACNLIVKPPTDPSNLQIRLRGPGDPFASPVWTSSPPYDSGGAGKQSFYIATGPRNAVDMGTATRWFIDVETISTYSGSTIDYGITCQSGNGTEIPWFRGTGAYVSSF